MADYSPNRGRRTHLDASGQRQVVFCHLCDNEWWKDEHGLKCPRCHGEATEIVTPTNDPRSMDYSLDPPHPPEPQPRRLHRDHSSWNQDDPPDPEEARARHPHSHHNSWNDEDVPDPEEADPEEYSDRSPSGHRTYYSSTFTSTGPGGSTHIHRQGHPSPRDHANPMQDFQTMMGAMMAPGVRRGQVGRTGPDAFTPQVHFPFGGAPMGGQAPGQPQMMGHRVTVTATGPQTLNVNGQVVNDDLVTILGTLFGAQGPFQANGQPAGQAFGAPVAAGFFTGLLTPRNGVAGDAVYSQEALDRIVTNLMEQHPQSGAPGPAPLQAIANLPKKKLDAEMLGPELKAECSVCMDDVTVGIEVVVLPCRHWFHETCARAWLSEHNTCPICRSGIGNNSQDAQPQQSSPQNPQSPSSPTFYSPPMSREWAHMRPPPRPIPTLNELRLNSIRERSGLSPHPPGSSSSNPPPPFGNVNARRYHIISNEGDRFRHRTPSPPGGRASHSALFRRRDSEISDGQRESRRAASGSDRSQRGSDSSHATASGGSGIGGWIRRFGRGGEGSGGSGNGGSSSASGSSGGNAR